jgi:UDP-glucose 4-epimerase
MATTTTRPGTCIRDYIDVEYLCAAHLLALEYLDGGDGCHAFDFGTGRGFRVPR